MQLKLVLKRPERLAGIEPEKILQSGSMTIGRSPEADWTLPDPQRIISKLHCRIERDLSGFVLVDTSTNGVRVNDETIGYGLPRLLADGDVLVLGEAIVQVSVQAAQPDAPLPGDATPAHSQARPEGPFGASESTFADEANAASPETIEDDWWLSGEPFAPLAASNSVDISVPMPTGPIPATTQLSESLPSKDGEVVKLANSIVGLGANDLARAVDVAAAALPENERQTFYRQLRGLLTGMGFGEEQ